MASSELYRWLRKKPLPSAIRCTDEDGKVRTINVTPGRGTWLHMEESVRAVKAVSIEALDDKGDLLRAIDLETETPAEDEDEPKGAKAAANAAGRAHADTARLLEANSKSIVDAYTAGANTNKAALDSVLQALGTLTEHFSDALSNMNALSVQASNAMQAAAQAKADGAAEPASESDKALGALVSIVSAKAGLSRPAAPAHANGASKPPNAANDKKKG